MRCGIKRGILVIATVFFAVPASFSVNAKWYRGVGGWHYEEQDKEGEATFWKQIDGLWYYFDADGVMQTGWVRDGNCWYFLHGDGQMAAGWIMTGEDWYYLDCLSGVMLFETVTPDGYRVGVDGRWDDIPAGWRVRQVGGGSGGNGGGDSGHEKGTDGERSWEGETEEESEAEEYGESGAAEGNNEEGTGEIIFGVEEAGDENEVGNAGEGTEEYNREETHGGEMTEEYGGVEHSSPSNAQIRWNIYFVDSEDHGYSILREQEGNSAEGEKLRILFPEIVIGKDGYQWKSLKHSPLDAWVRGNGIQKIYIEYENIGEIEKPVSPDDAAKKRLREWEQKAASSDALITGIDSADLPGSAWIVMDKRGNERRIKELLSMIGDQNQYYFYSIGKNYVPDSLPVGRTLIHGVYSVDKMDDFMIGDSRYVVERVSVKKSYNMQDCDHILSRESGYVASCLIDGKAILICDRCGFREIVILPACGHVDLDGDSFCDVCGKRAFTQKQGAVIDVRVTVDGKKLVFPFECIDTHYQGKMLYISRHVIDPEITGEMDTEDYNHSSVRDWLNHFFANECSAASGLCEIDRTDGDGFLDKAIVLSREETERYMDRMGGGKEYLTRTYSGEGGRYAADKMGAIGVIPKEEVMKTGIRPAILLDCPKKESGETVHWNLGDAQLRLVGKELRLFRCIDEDYEEGQSDYQRSALFLCDSVIEVDRGKGPEGIVFGSDNNYKNSAVRKWLGENRGNNLFGLRKSLTGVTVGYCGSIGKGAYEQMDEEKLTGSDIGFQLLEDRFFILSVEEAVRYKEYLWKFGGSAGSNPDTQYSKRRRGYWLRTPFYPFIYDEFNYGKQAYIVDLYDGNVHPAQVNIDGIGIRPAFAVPQL